MDAKTNIITNTIMVSDNSKFDSVNVRNKENIIVGKIKNGEKVKLTDFNESAERNIISGKDMNTGKAIKGSVLTKCLS